MHRVVCPFTPQLSLVLINRPRYNVKNYYAYGYVMKYAYDVLISTVALAVLVYGDMIWEFVFSFYCLRALRCVSFSLSATVLKYKKAQLSLTNPRDAKVCQQLLQFDVFTTLSLTILAYLHSFTCCCVRNLRNPAKFTKNSNL